MKFVSHDGPASACSSPEEESVFSLQARAAAETATSNVAPDCPGPGISEAIFYNSEYLKEICTRLFESASEPMLATDSQGRILGLNGEAERQFGYSREELTGEIVEKLVPERLQEAHRRVRLAYQATPSFRPMNRGHEMIALRKDGTEFAADVSLSPVPIGDDWIFYSIIRDTTERISAAEVANRLRFEQCLAGLSAKFINLAPDQVDREIENGLSVLTEALDADRTTVAQIDPNTGDFVVTHSHVRPGVPRFPQRVLKGVLPWLESKLLSGEIATTAHPDELPDEAQHEREYMKSVGEKSAIVVPFRVGGRVIGGMSTDSFREYRRWDNLIISRVQDVADIFANALARKQADERLQVAYSEIQRLKQQLETENTYLREEINLAFHHCDVVGSSPGIRSVLKKVEQVAPTNSAVLILGETGTGKELIARTIHELSERRNRPMVKVNCAALPTSLIESELFGRERGAYTGALAREIGRFELGHNSTIFLDEIGELPVEVQSKLLRVLQEGEFERLGSSKTISVDVRVIAATSRNLQAMVDQGKFREDLFYRLNVFPIAIPPLRERAEDIPALVWHILKDLSKRMGRKIEGVHASTMQDFQRYGWPGNIRELRNVIERNLILNTGAIFRAEIPELEPGVHRNPRRLDEVEAEHMRAVLQTTRWRVRGKGGAAEIIGLKPTTLEAKMKKLGIRRPS